jgi:sorbitol-specific phosphotransferase system component IIBC
MGKPTINHHSIAMLNYQRVDGWTDVSIARQIQSAIADCFTAAGGDFDPTSNRSSNVETHTESGTLATRCK